MYDNLLINAHCHLNGCDVQKIILSPISKDRSIKFIICDFEMVKHHAILDCTR